MMISLLHRLAFFLFLLFLRPFLSLSLTLSFSFRKIMFKIHTAYITNHDLQ